MENVKDYKVTHVGGTTFTVQEQLNTWRFGKSCKVDVPAELLAGKWFIETVDLVKMYVAEGRIMQDDIVNMQRVNGDREKMPQVFEEDDYIPEPTRWETLDLRRYATYWITGVAVVGAIILMVVAGSSTHAEQPIETIQEAPLSQYEVIQKEIDELGQKRITELKHQEELRTIRKGMEDTIRTKVASINEDINGSKDRVINIDGDVAKLKTQQVTLSTTVINN